MIVYLTYLLIDSHFTHGYNYGLGYIASVLKQEGYKVRYFPIWNSQDLNNFYKDIRKENPKIVAFSATSSQFPFLKDIAKNIRQFSNTFLVCGGAHPTLKPDSISEIPELDAIVIGEGEYAMLDLANSIKNEKNYEAIQSCWFQKNGRIIKNNVRPLIENLNVLPAPDKESLDYQNVIDTSNGINRFIFSRGCTFKCSYCSNHALSDVYSNKSKYYRFIDPKKAIEIIRRDHERYQFKSIIFDDDTISLNKKWFFEFFELYKKNFKYPFRCNLRVETVNEDIIKLLKEANAKGIGIGLEHGDEEFRKNVLQRKMSNDSIKNVFALCDKYDISHDDFIMVGFPKENRKLFFETVKLSREVGAVGEASIFQPYPSTKLAKICEDNNWVPEKEVFKERLEAVIDFPEFSKEDIQLCSDVFPFLNKYKKIPLLDSTIYLQMMLAIYLTELRIIKMYSILRKSVKYMLFSLFTKQ